MTVFTTALHSDTCMRSVRNMYEIGCTQPAPIPIPVNRDHNNGQRRSTTIWFPWQCKNVKWSKLLYYSIALRILSLLHLNMAISNGEHYQLCFCARQERTRKLLEVRNAPRMHIVYKRQILQSNTTCTPRHGKENHLL